MPSPPRSLIVLAAIALALPLAACGRKGALDPPPGGYVLEQGTTTTPVTSRGGTRVDSSKQQELDDEGRPIAPEGRKKKLPGDVLID